MFSLFCSETDELIKAVESAAEQVDNAAEAIDQKIMSNSKEVTKEKLELDQKVSEGGIMSIIYSAAKKIAVVVSCQSNLFCHHIDYLNVT